MSNRRVQVVVLCEGVKDYWFAYKCLVTCGWRRDQITVNRSNAGKESAFTFVLNQYTTEVRANRQGKKKERALLVMIDGDGQPEDGRESELAKRLAAAKQKPRQATERIALWVPRKQLETWVYFLTHGEADEEAEYKRTHRVKEKEYTPAADLLAKLLKEQRSLPLKALPSLRKAVAEFRRLRAPSIKASKVSKRRR